MTLRSKMLNAVISIGEFMIFRNTLILTGVAASLISGSFSAWAGSPASSDAWDSMNSPTRLAPDFDYHYDRLPLAKKVPREHMPWSDTYWPSNRGSIAYRWHSSKPGFAWNSPREVNRTVFDFKSPTRAEALKMSPEEIAELSPAEKFDLVRGDYDYPLTKKAKKRGGPLRAYWEGICHGWAPASVNHAEPKPVKVRNPDGIEISFGSADVKAVLDFYYGTVNMHWESLGGICHVDLDKNPNSTDPACLDVNAGSFHIVMANYIGLRGTPFIADVSRGYEVWNNPIYAYESKEVNFSGPTSNSPPKTIRRILVETDVRYSSDHEDLGPQWDATVGTPETLVTDDLAKADPHAFDHVFRYETDHYSYWLDLSVDNVILGGEWVSADRPDYLWMKKPMKFEGDFEALNRIYDPVTFPATPAQAAEVPLAPSEP
jgi:hypothetical protein